VGKQKPIIKKIYFQATGVTLDNVVVVVFFPKIAAQGGKKGTWTRASGPVSALCQPVTSAAAIASIVLGLMKTAVPLYAQF